MSSGGVFRSVIEAAVPIDEVRAVDAEIAWRANGSGALVLRIGEALDKLVTSGAHKTELGFSNLDSYAKQRCGYSGRWAGEARTLARRLSKLPALRISYKAGHLEHSLALVLARYATPETEVDLLLRSAGASVRTMERTLKQQGKPVGAPARAETDPDESGEPAWWVTLQRTMPREDLARLEVTRMAVERLVGEASSWQWLEWLLAETTTAMINDGVDVMREDLAEEHEGWRQRREQAEARRDAREAKAEQVVLAHKHFEDAFVEEEPLPDDPYALDALIQQLCAELASRELFLGRMLDKFVRMKGPKRLGYADEVQYARERLGMSRGSMRSWITLVRRTRNLPRLRDALADGEISCGAARLIARVAEPETEAKWIERAKVRTYKHLREEIDAVEMVARVTGDRRALVPPSEEDLEHIRALERDAVTGELMRAADDDDPESVDRALAEAFVQMSAYPGRPQQPADPGTARLGQARWGQRVPDDVALHYKELETVHREENLPGTFVQYMCRAFFKTWLPQLRFKMKWWSVHARDLFRCTSPVCFRRDVTGHHMRYRSAGGGDEDENVTSPCAQDHLGNIHAHGSIKLYPPASNPTWVFGRLQTLFVVTGREKRPA